MELSIIFIQQKIKGGKNGLPETPRTRKIGSKKRRARKRNKRNNQNFIYGTDNSNKKIDILILLFSRGNKLCLIISQNPEFLDNTIFVVTKLVGRVFQFHILMVGCQLVGL